MFGVNSKAFCAITLLAFFSFKCDVSSSLPMVNGDIEAIRSRPGDTPAFASDLDLEKKSDENTKTVVVSWNLVSWFGRDVAGMIFKLVSTETNPAVLSLVCKPWRDLLYKDRVIEQISGQPIALLKPGRIMQECVTTFWSEFSVAVIYQIDHNHRDQITEKVKILDILLDPKNKTRTIELEDRLITLNWNTFSTFEQSAEFVENQVSPVYILFALRHHMVALLTKLEEGKDPSVKGLADILGRWDSKRPAAFLWRRWDKGAEKQLLCDEFFGDFDELTGESLFQKWLRSSMQWEDKEDSPCACRCQGEPGLNDYCCLFGNRSFRTIDQYQLRVGKYGTYYY